MCPPVLACRHDTKNPAEDPEGPAKPLIRVEELTLDRMDQCNPPPHTRREYGTIFYCVQTLKLWGGLLQQVK